ncbi:isopenicillin-N N-acyltransferase-like protein [Bacillus pakistanensis]|uniref:Isopenicillin-N N-acyltransferase-like protein n=1 Tax=Rossellomorea pakistanensis TaxID=992288 RepID=A0ABS2NHV3_9BACI|nr:C45 family peptidase [Bacillus pakistanensis]MBM7587405.1 isopenicillin-N N-acyltransferase-like protein [Bacillus pakistanensis]
MKKLKLQGSAYHIGVQHGRQGKEEVHQSLETYEKLFYGYSRLSWKEANHKALLHLPSIEKFRPEYIDEMEGIAEGAGVSFADILTLNARSEIALTNANDGCSALAIQAETTWLAQNWDWTKEQQNSLLSIEMTQADKPRIQMVTEGGIIGKIGCNSEGIGVCLNALKTKTWAPKIPIHIGLRAILESNTFDEALDTVIPDQIASPAHFLVASKDGNAIGLEVSPRGTSRIEPKDGAVVHTNHICSAHLQTNVPDYPIQDSFQRLDTLMTQIDEHNQPVTVETIKQWLSDHTHYPNSICRHKDPTQLKHEQMETVFSIIMNLGEGNVTIIPGKPCEDHR